MPSMLLRFVDSVFDRIFAVIFAILFIQIPHLIILYLHVLKGALFEAGKAVKMYQDKALVHGLSLDQYIEKLTTNADPVVKSSGTAIGETVDRLTGYKQAVNDITGAGPWEQPFAFFKHFDYDVFSQITFKPALSFSFEAFLYGLVGLVFGWLFYQLVRLPFTMFLGKKPPAAAPPPPARRPPPRRMMQ